jgi:hypothetical protein
VANSEGAVRKKIFSIPSDDGTWALPAGPDSIILQQLKEKFLETTNRSVKVTILTLLPKDWCIRKIEEEFSDASMIGESVEPWVISYCSAVYGQVCKILLPNIRFVHQEQCVLVSFSGVRLFTVYSAMKFSTI